MDMIASLTGGQDPNQAVIQANGGVPQQAPPPQAATPPAPTTPQGVSTPVTNPQDPKNSPMVTQSPPDLANMYAKLMAVNEKNQNAASLDSGLTLMAAGLSNNLQTRQSLIHAASSGAGAKQQFGASDIVAMNKAAVEQQQRMIRLQALPALMKQYNMTPAQAQALEASGKLDEVLQAHATRSLAHITDQNGQIHMVDDRAEGGRGKIITTLGTEKPDPKQVIKTPLGEQVINLETGEKVGPAHGPTDANVDAKGTKFPALDIGYDYARDEAGLVKLTNGVPTVAATPGSKAQQAEIEAQQKKVNAKVQASAAISSVANAVAEANQAYDESIIPGAVGLGSKAYNMTIGQLGGTAGNVIRDNIDTIKANASFDKLAAMRAASPTGGALGNVSDFENKLLSSATATLSPNLTMDKLRDNMFRVQATMELLANKSYKDGDEKTFNTEVAKRISELKTERVNKTNKGVTVTRE